MSQVAIRLQVLNGAKRKRIHAASLHVLERTGVAVKLGVAREILVAAGAAVDGDQVRIPGDLVDRTLSSPPRSSELRRREATGAPLGLAQGQSWFGSGPDCPIVHDPKTRERRRARLADVTAAARFAEALPNIDFVMSMGLPEDARPEALEQAQFAAMAAATSKPIVLSSPFGAESMRRTVELAAACGERRSVACLVMSTSPLTLDGPMLEKVLACGELQVPVIVAPAVSAGSAAPASLASALALGNAEVLAGLVIHQLAAPGAPFVYGTGVGVFDMRTMTDTYGAPGGFLGNQGGCEMAASYGLPSWSYAGHSDSKLLDEQWSLDSAVSTVFGALSGATMLHDVGYLEAGLASSLEAMVLGDELVGFARSFMAGLEVTPETLLLDEIAAVGPGGAHLGRRETRRRYRGFWYGRLLDHLPHERWHATGAATLRDRVSARTTEILSRRPGFSPSPGVAALLEAVVAESSL